MALVRNVMLGREGLHRETLLQLARDAGAQDIRSHLTTGNLTFASALGPGVLADRLEAGVERVIGRHEMVAVRRLGWLQDLVASDPFAGFDAARWALEVGLLRHDAPVIEGARLPDPQRTTVVAVHDREVLTARPTDGGRRPHVNRLLESASGRPSTSRGWSTMVRLASA